MDIPKMAKVFGEASTTDEVLSGVNLKGKRVLVTGVSSGLGVETARSLAAHGAQVIGAARDLKKTEAATEEVRRDAAATHSIAKPPRLCGGRARNWLESISNR